ncbi:MAG: hypothetical protein HYV34_01360 [Candidatus Kerfeldbacteria bacterium]|nr:hypothetical protein [Candidatus Kerfeldbacteria bacterium]
MKNIYFAIKTVLKGRRNFLIFVITAVAFLVLFIIIPVTLIPGNTIFFQLSIFTAREYSLMVFLAILTGLHFAMQVFHWRQGRNARTQVVTQGAASGLFGVFGSVVGTAACASCLASLFAFIGLGTGSVFFVLKNQLFFLGGVILLMLIAIYFSAKKVNKLCNC